MLSIHNAECSLCCVFMLSIILFSFINLNIILLSWIMLIVRYAAYSSVDMMCNTMLSVVAVSPWLSRSPSEPKYIILFFEKK
jgi:hypothetical protein